MRGFTLIEAESKDAFAGAGRFPLRAYSEFMPPPYVGTKPYDPLHSRASVTAIAREDSVLDISEYEQSQELDPGLDHIASSIVTEIAKLARGTSRLMSRTLLSGNPAWPSALADAAAHHGFVHETFTIAMPLALSRTQDDKGNVRWTLFGTSHDGPARAFWGSFGADDGARFAKVVGWMIGKECSLETIRIHAGSSENPLPVFAKRLVLGDTTPIDAVKTLVTFEPFARLPAHVQAAYLERRLHIVPSPGSLVFFEHPRYAALARQLPRATQIPLLHLFSRVQGGYAIRIPQSGWLDEYEAGHEGFAGGHRIVSSVVRSHRWQRVERDQTTGEHAFADKVTTALFSTDPDDIGLYGKPMARNAEIWTEDYELLLDGPHAGRQEIARAAQRLRDGGRFGYRFYYPPMQSGIRELFWHYPLIARLEPEARRVTRYSEVDAPQGYVGAETASAPTIVLVPRKLDRPGHREAAMLFPRDPGHARNTTLHNVRKVLDFAELLGAPLSPSFARQLVQVPRHASYEDWLARLSEIASHPHRVRDLTTELRRLADGQSAEGAARTFHQTANRDYEERLWRTIASLAEGEFLNKDNADSIAVNRGKTGGSAARLGNVMIAELRDLERLGDSLRVRHRELIAKHHMEGRADVLDHVFTWETDFEFPWSGGWSKNQTGEARERNIVIRIPGRNRSEAVLMADHYDTAYMEDVYEPERGGDGLRASAHGADDNHSGTAALLLAADVLLPLAREGKLERDVWLIHLTGEEFPADCMGARALAQGLVERSLHFRRDDGSREDVSSVRIAGAYVLDMVAHNNMRDRDAFFICPGEGAASARLALRAHIANHQWNENAVIANAASDRAGRGRALRMPDGAQVPPLFEHLPVVGQIAAEWEPRSVLYNTDGQIFSDVGIPVVLIMENYDINRVGYHDTHDTMSNIDLDYAAALTAIAIEAVTQTALAPIA